MSLNNKVKQWADILEQQLDEYRKNPRIELADKTTKFTDGENTLVLSENEVQNVLKTLNKLSNETSF